jgi:hypothetical protein
MVSNLRMIVDVDGSCMLISSLTVIAVVLYGDPSHVVGQPWDLGTSNHTGIFPRQDNLACAPYGRKIKSWCDTGDIYCDAGNTSGIRRFPRRVES